MNGLRAGGSDADDDTFIWYRQYKRSLEWARSEFPDGYDVCVPGRHAWNLLTEAERGEALQPLFYAYGMLSIDQEQAERLNQAARDGTSYLREFDEAMLWDSVVGRDLQPEDVAANRDALLNVLCELDLLRHRLKCAQNPDEMDTPEDP